MSKKCTIRIVVLFLFIIGASDSFAQVIDSAAWLVQERIEERVKRIEKGVNEVGGILKTPKSEMPTKSKLEVLWNMMDSVLLEKKVNTDTAYVARPDEAWTVKVRYDRKSTFFVNNEKFNGEMNKYFFENDVNSSISASINYRGLSFAMSLNPKKFLGLTSDTEINFNYYNNRFGFDITYSNVKRFHGSSDYSDLWFRGEELDYWGNSRLKSYSANAYYVFSGRRFSYPAAFSHSWIQKKSAGSLIAGASFYSGKLDFDLNSLDAEQAKDLIYMSSQTRMAFVALNLGYAYNYVPNPHWLIHASFTPGLMLWKNYETDVVDLNVDEQTNEVGYTFRETQGIPKRFFDCTGIARLGLTYSWDKYFAGVTGVAQFEHVGDSNQFTIFGCRWKVRGYVGFRL